MQDLRQMLTRQDVSCGELPARILKTRVLFRKNKKTKRGKNNEKN
jgi:hypothetical protein